MGVKKTGPKWELAQQLKAARLRAGLGPHNAGALIKADEETIRRYERGGSTPDYAKLQRLMDGYGITDEGDRNVLEELREQAKQKSWYSSYRLPESVSRLVAFEALAERIKVYEHSFVFGGLQTRAYAREVIARTSSPDATDDQIEKYVRLRMERQGRIYHVSHPPMLQVILNEAVIRTEVGGTQVMYEQLEYLRGLKDPWNLRILPFRAGAHPSMAGSYWYLDFPKDVRDPVIYEEVMFRSLYLDDSKSLASGSVIFNELWRSSLDEEASRVLISKQMEALKDEPAYA